ncbi:hypothetical protein DDZ13_08780 [Coraliomargarita sinensis]|uniref:Uncharacterized protein n=1 Tax=Coraliomargarita sinensis TaxID=2174842 RepID=A0A317ZIS7_9BACT|nr:hypothetical protein [Coraliomargarita sinensis]PXA04123.1 hypothetical protein DDZ13_08780 [Coraliomargarita sinensis]
MRYIGLLLLPLFLSPLPAIDAKESILEQLSLVKTDFKFTVDNIPLEIRTQGITLRAVEVQREHKISSETKQINDFAYRAYHLEFSFEREYKFPAGFDVVEFYSGNDLIRSISLKRSGRKFTAAEGRLHEDNFIAINLRGVPLAVLDSVDRVNFRGAK